MMTSMDLRNATKNILILKCLHKGSITPLYNIKKSKLSSKQLNVIAFKKLLTSQNLYHQSTHTTLEQNLLVLVVVMRKCLHSQTATLGHFLHT